ncbi:MAG: LuxR C-terminal-related transcriptional regulator [Candidatus Binatia bacterium]
MSDDADDGSGLGAAIVLFAVIFSVIAADLLGDWTAGTSPGHLAAELAVLAAAATGVGLLWRRLRRLHHEAATLGTRLAEAQAEAERWRSETRGILRGLGDALGEQFQRWSLTPAEQEVALLLVKGLSHKEIANVRSTSERTVRQQALGIYRKAGLGGRAELSAFFLEDLLLPMQRGPG